MKLNSFSFNVFIISILLGIIHSTSGSLGDISFIHQRCLIACRRSQCKTDANDNLSEPGVDFRFYPLTFPERVIVWGCAAECRYHCMWWTVDAFAEDKLAIPQFYGKWPQMRLFGFQEPASALFSLFNLFTQVSTLGAFARSVSHHAPFYFVWIFFSLAGANAWFWSFIFHTFDVDFTERMDYCSAFGYTLIFLLVLLLRIAYRAPSWFSYIIVAAFALFFLKHAHYLLLSERINYGYNMQICTALGLLTILGWMVLPHYLLDRREQNCARTVQTAVILIGLFSLFEIFDFPALFWLFDGHAIWHAATIGIPYLIFRFAIEDCHYLLEAKL